MATGNKWKRRLEEGGEEELVDRISGLPDAVLSDIITLLHTKAGARTQVLFSRWRHIWRAAPLNFDPAGDDIPDGEVSRILSAHRGPGRCFRNKFPLDILASHAAATMDGWLRSPTLDNLQELEFNSGL
ncbi:unnamed protein product [Urochloa humidicola]